MLQTILLGVPIHLLYSPISNIIQYVFIDYQLVIISTIHLIFFDLQAFCNLKKQTQLVYNNRGIFSCNHTDHFVRIVLNGNNHKYEAKQP